MREPVERRRQRILDAVRSRGTARVTDLAAELEVSVVTVRRDVEELARGGELRRGHGVARSTAPLAADDGLTGTGALTGASSPQDGDAVGLVVPERHSYLFEAVHGARAVVEAAGMRLAMHIAPHAPASEHAMSLRALESGVRGLLIAPRWRSAAAERDDYDWLAGLDVPTVLMERRPSPGSSLHAMDSVRSDHWYGVHLALEHLTALGHRRIVLAARDDSPTARTLRSAFAQIATEHEGIDDWVVVLSSPGAVPEPAAPESSTPPLDLAAVLRERRATAAILHGDVDALMLVQQLQDAGLQVPRDCSVIAYDDVVAALGSTPLSAVAPPKEEIGRAAAELLLRRLAHPPGARPEAVRRMELLPDLKVRGSTARASQ
ncbi:substrate-binding domain-containing protein [Streptomyces albidus (ex Kaewkla and Franco 2022)]|uniref:substrate-binding domain-containing protein n=1 Tax=Streptomyces albidus (ex Kaewkla and Franco 2022) TaxID=722709 RepID=UPI0015EF4331|nr:substrate-binding domain-containing protein [Streptomyces albidus (ex Kaewkla and Franco 2022)]